jgi:DNA-binding response OmpR family regulator
MKGVPPMLRVLVVDDDPSIRALLEYTLSFEDFDVTSVSDGQAALDHLKFNRPDIVLLDVMMPVIDGIEVAKSIRSDNDLEDVPVIMMSAKTQDMDIMAGWVAGAASYVTKPFDLDLLLQEIHRITAERRLQVA